MKRLSGVFSAALCALARLVFALGLCESGKRLTEALGRGWLHDDNEAAARRVAVWARGLLAAEGLLIVEHDGQLSLEGEKILKQKRYGKTFVSYIGGVER